MIQDDSSQKQLAGALERLACLCLPDGAGPAWQMAFSEAVVELRRIFDDLRRQNDQLAETRRQVEEALTKQEAYLRQVIDINPHMIFAKDRDGRFTLVNRAVAKMYGSAVEDLTGKTDADFNPNPEEVAFFRRMDLQVMDSLQEARIPEEVITDASGKVHWLQTIKRPITDEQGRAYEVLGVATDITDMKRTEEALQRANDQLELRVAERTAELRAILEAIPDLFFRLGKDGTILQFYAGSSADLYLPPAEFLGRRMGDVLPPLVGETISRAVREVSRTGLSTTVEYALPMQAGEQVYEARFWPFQQDEVIAVSRNITERKRREEELERAHQEAQRASQARSEFLSRMSHEIRTPLTAILSCARALSESGMNDSTSIRCLEMLTRNGEHLHALLCDILDVSKISSGKMEVERMVCDPREILEEVAAISRPKIAGRPIHLRVEIDDAVPRWLISDSIKLRQVLINLADNAIKFTKRGFVRLGLSPAGPPAEERAEVRFSVEDSGIGISSQEQAAIFDPFNQADSSIARRFGGTGLGLSIVKGMVELLGGQVELRSEVGKGSVFSFDLSMPISRVGPPPKPKDQPSALPLHRLDGVRVLVAEDAEDIRDILDCLLRDAGASVKVVSQGLEALRAATKQEFDVILLDIRMPDMDGIATLGEMHARGIDTPVLALTADATKERRRQCLEAGFDDFLSKPFQIEALIHKIASVLPRPPGELPDEPGPDSSDAQLDDRCESGPIRSRFANGPSAEAAISRNFALNLGAKIERLRQLLAGRDALGLRELAHQISGSGGTNGYPSVSDKAGKLEIAAEKKDFANAERHFAALVEIHERVLMGIEAERNVSG